MSKRSFNGEVPTQEGMPDIITCDVSGLSRTESELLRYLAANSGRPVSRDEILANVWRLDPARVSTRTVDMHIVKLRHKLGDNPQKPRRLLTVRNTGYMLIKGSGICAKDPAWPRKRRERVDDQ